MSEVRYYLLPAVLDPSWEDNPILTEPPADTGIQPKYLSQIEARSFSVRGLLAEELAPDASGRRWLRNHYIVRIMAADGTDWSLLDSRTDVLRFTRQILVNNIAKLEALGIDTTGLTLTTPRKAIERRLVQWLQNRDNDLETAFAVPGAIIDGI